MVAIASVPLGSPRTSLALALLVVVTTAAGCGGLGSDRPHSVSAQDLARGAGFWRRLNLSQRLLLAGECRRMPTVAGTSRVLAVDVWDLAALVGAELRDGPLRRELTIERACRRALHRIVVLRGRPLRAARGGTIDDAHAARLALHAERAIGRPVDLVVRVDERRGDSLDVSVRIPRTNDSVDAFVPGRYDVRDGGYAQVIGWVGGVQCTPRCSVLLDPKTVRAVSGKPR